MNPAALRTACFWLQCRGSAPFRRARAGMLRVASATFFVCGMTHPTAQAADDAPIAAFSAAPVGEPPAAWHFATLPRKTPTRFGIVALGGEQVLKVEADDAYGTLIHAVQRAAVAHPVLRWHWRVDQLVENADLRSRDGDDSPAKLCVFFAFDAGKLSFGERAKLALAHTTTQQDVPTEALCYVWDNKLPVDTAAVNAFTRRMRFIVLQSGADKLGQWVSEQRDIVADHQRLFGDESPGTTPDITGVAVGADADNTHGHAVAYFGDITLSP